MPGYGAGQTPRVDVTTMRHRMEQVDHKVEADTLARKRNSAAQAILFDACAENC